MGDGRLLNSQAVALRLAVGGIELHMIVYCRARIALRASHSNRGLSNISPIVEDKMRDIERGHIMGCEAL